MKSTMRCNSRVIFALCVCEAFIWLSCDGISSPSLSNIAANGLMTKMKSTISATKAADAYKDSTPEDLTAASNKREDFPAEEITSFAKVNDPTREQKHQTSSQCTSHASSPECIALDGKTRETGIPANRSQRKKEKDEHPLARFIQETFENPSTLSLFLLSFSGAILSLLLYTRAPFLHAIPSFLTAPYVSSITWLAAITGAAVVLCIPSKNSGMKILCEGIRDVCILLSLITSIPVAPTSALLSAVFSLIASTLLAYRQDGQSQRWSPQDEVNPVLEATRASSYTHQYANVYYSLCRSEELLPGQIKQVHALGKSFAVFRPEDGGTACIIDAVCPHMVPSCKLVISYFPP